MAQPLKENSQLADSSGNPMIAGRGASVLAAAAATYGAPAVTASATGALTAVDINFTWTANVPGITNGAATIDDGNTVGDDNDAGGGLSVLEDQFIKLRADIVATNVEVDALVVDDATNLVELDDLADDVALIRTGLNDLIGRIEAHGLLADN